MKTATVLIVDDDATFVRFVMRTLGRSGYTVLSAADGCEVPDMLANHQVDLLLLDLQMPGMNGWEVIRQLRKQPPGRVQKTISPPKVVVVSGRHEDETAEFVRRLGADAYLTKPCWGEQILATVRQVLERGR